MAYPKRPSREELSSPEVLKAVALQNDYRARVQLTDDFGQIRRIAGIDTGYDLERGLAKAVIAIFSWPSLELETTVIAYEKVDFPYIPGFLAFREIPAILRGLDCLTAPPDMVMVDGQGVAHPRRMGIAAHLGVVTGLPAIGVAKSRLTGRCGALPQDSEFATTPLMDKEERIGTVLGSKRNCNPLYVSAGHRMSQETALSLTLQCFRGYRLPEPTRIADQISKWKLPGMDGLVSKAAKKKGRPDDSTGDLFQ